MAPFVTPFKKSNAAPGAPQHTAATKKIKSEPAHPADDDNLADVKLEVKDEPEHPVDAVMNNITNDDDDQEQQEHDHRQTEVPMSEYVDSVLAGASGDLEDDDEEYPCDAKSHSARCQQRSDQWNHPDDSFKMDIDKVTGNQFAAHVLIKQREFCCSKKAGFCSKPVNIKQLYKKKKVIAFLGNPLTGASLRPVRVHVPSRQQLSKYNNMIYVVPSKKETTFNTTSKHWKGKQGAFVHDGLLIATRNNKAHYVKKVTKKAVAVKVKKEKK